MMVVYYPVVRREPRSQGYSYSVLNGEPRSYLEFSNRPIVQGPKYQKNMIK